MTRWLMRRRVAAWAIFGGFALLPLVAALTGDPYLVVVATRILAFAMAALALDLILGYGGMVSFGHAAYLGIGAYAVAILSRAGITDLGAHLGVAVVAGAAFALVTGAISLRTRGIYFIMITLAFAQMAYFFFVSLSAYGGDDGVTLTARSTVLGQDWLADDRVLYTRRWRCCGALSAVCRDHRVAVRAGADRARENPLRMQAVGFTPFRFQLTAFVISGAMTAIAGGDLANQASFVSPSYMNWHRSGELVVMVVLGGIGNLLGAIAGATLALLLEEWLALFTEHWRLIFGALLILVVLFSRDGLTGLFRGRAK